VSINGTELIGGRREPNPYREGGLAFDQGALRALLSAESNSVVIEL
jgi:hypothetical protein